MKLELYTNLNCTQTVFMDIKFFDFITHKFCVMCSPTFMLSIFVMIQIDMHLTLHSNTFAMPMI